MTWRRIDNDEISPPYQCTECDGDARFMVEIDDEDSAPAHVCRECLAAMIEQVTGYKIVPMLNQWDRMREVGRDVVRQRKWHPVGEDQP